MSAKPIEDQTTRGWAVEINGQLVTDVSHLKLLNPRFGVLEYGDVGGYDAWNFYENGGGGSVIVPYVIKGQYLYVLMVEQNRPNQGGRVWNAARGFLDPGEDHFRTAVTELEDEAGIRSTQLFSLGAPLNPNSAFFVTSGDDEGVHPYGLRIDESEVKLESADALDGPLVFNDASIQPVSKPAELIYGGKFFRYEDALAVSDMFTVAAVSRLMRRWILAEL